MPYTIQLKHLYQQVKQGKARWDGGSFIDYPDLDDETKDRLYNWQFYERLGQGDSNRPLECAPTWHMSAGGVRADIKTMKTRVPGLFIAGPVGGHTLGGLNFATYDGILAGRQAAHGPTGWAHRLWTRPRFKLSRTRSPPSSRTPAMRATRPSGSRTASGNVVWEQLMFVKSAPGLKKALSELESIKAEMVPRMQLRTGATRYNTDLVDALDVQDMLQVAEMVIHAALAREESRGPHFREDFPFTDNKSWLKYVVVSHENETVRTRLERPGRSTCARAGVLDYFANPYA